MSFDLPSCGSLAADGPSPRAFLVTAFSCLVHYVVKRLDDIVQWLGPDTNEAQHGKHQECNGHEDGSVSSGSGSEEHFGTKILAKLKKKFFGLKRGV